jgi:hypothetical protein
MRLKWLRLSVLAATKRKAADNHPLRVLHFTSLWVSQSSAMNGRAEKRVATGPTVTMDQQRDYLVISGSRLFAARSIAPAQESPRTIARSTEDLSSRGIPSPIPASRWYNSELSAQSGYETRAF